MRKVIAIDGPSGAGKSTIARLLAEKLGFAYLDTGALYRAVALNLRKLGLDENASISEVVSALERTQVEFTNGSVFLNGKDVSAEIRSPEAGHYASVFSARKEVREFLMSAQREAALNADLVAEGRDMTTVVFPDASMKFYLDASVDERARRRGLELAAKGFDTDADSIRADIMSRDTRDAGRDIAPLMKADDAHVIDSTGLSVEEVSGKILKIIAGDQK